MTDADLLDRALGGSNVAPPPEMQRLLDIAGELRSTMSEWRLSPERRAELFARAVDLAGEPRSLRRRALRRWRRPALLGGGLITAGAATAIVIAVLRGRQARQPAPA